jgi:tRNA uridine 5-carboxymethylaminomethyl modification enzyme
VGPRYCPSIEDKVVRFKERGSHHVFLEPESHETDWVYCNGIATSLPRDVQAQIVAALPGCANAEVVQWGYAVEYDMVRPHQIDATCMTRSVAGLFLAGQINGTSGYEEAAGQGLIAGINAVRFARQQERIVLGRDEAYIGVMMDDLVTKTPIEPYRMFTSRAEHRLLLRSDSTADRLTPIAIELGLADAERQRVFARRRAALDNLRDVIGSAVVAGEPLSRRAKRNEYTIDDLSRETGLRPGVEVPHGVLETALAEHQYEGYLVRQRAEVKRQERMERRRIPSEFSFKSVKGLRAEATHVLERFRPATLGQAGRLEGVNPADVTLLIVALERSAMASA